VSQEVAAAITAAAAEVATGGMIALIPDNPQAFTVPDGDPAAAMHMTLCFLGDVSGLDDATREELMKRVEVLAADNGPVEMRVQGVGIWNRDGGDTGDRKPSTNTLLQPTDQAQGLRDYADQIGRDALGARYPEQFQPWAPHICAGYDLDPAVLPKHDGMVRFSKVRLALAGDDQDFVLAGQVRLVSPVDPGTSYAQDGVTEMTDTKVKDTPEIGAMREDGTIPVFFPCLAVEGMETGDGRFIVPGALELRKPPLSVFAQTVNTGKGGHSGAEIVGNLAEAWRIPGPEFISRQTGEALPEGTFVWQGRGEIDSKTTGGGLFAKKYLRGNSIDLAEPDFVDDVTLADDGEEIHQVRVTHAYIGATTLCAIPAFRDAYAEVEGEEGGYSAPLDDLEAKYPKTAQGLADFLRDRGIEPVTASVSIPELGDACSPCLAEGELDKLPPAFLKNIAKKKAQAKGAKDDPEDATDSGADEGEENPDGSKKPDFLKKKIAARKASTAAGAPELPPVEWFQDPKLDGPTPLQIDPESGRIFGHIATWGTCHIGVAKRCVPPPHSKTDYAWFNTGALRAVDPEGERRTVAVGHLTMDTGHAGLELSADATVRHYDDTGTTAADVAAGEDAHGVWIAGIVRPELSEREIHALMAAAPSGDWRAKDGHLELCAVLAVNVPGYPVPRARVASGAPDGGVETTALVAAGATRPATSFGPNGLDLDDLADRISARVLAELRPPTDDLADQQAALALELEQSALAEELNAPFLDGGSDLELTADEAVAVDWFADQVTVAELAGECAHELALELPKDWRILSLPTALAVLDGAAVGAFNWVEKVGGLPKFIKRIVKHLAAKGMQQSRAIATAVNVVKKMCASGDTNWPGKQDVNAGSRAEACTAVADWEAKKARSHAN
jgi:2'-5' RNA ligase